MDEKIKMAESIANKYKIIDKYEQEVARYFPVEWREELSKIPNPTSRLEISMLKLHQEFSGVTFPPKIFAYIVGLNPEAPRALGTMLKAIINRREAKGIKDFPSHVMQVTKKESYNMDKTAELYKQFGISDGDEAGK